MYPGKAHLLARVHRERAAAAWEAVAEPGACPATPFPPATALNLPSVAETQQILNDVAKLNGLFQEDSYMRS